MKSKFALLTATLVLALSSTATSAAVAQSSPQSSCGCTGVIVHASSPWPLGSLSPQPEIETLLPTEVSCSALKQEVAECLKKEVYPTIQRLEDKKRGLVAAIHPLLADVKALLDAGHDTPEHWSSAKLRAAEKLQALTPKLRELDETERDLAAVEVREMCLTSCLLRDSNGKEQDEALKTMAQAPELYCGVKSSDEFGFPTDACERARQEVRDLRKDLAKLLK